MALTTNILIAIALLLGTPFFVIFGWLSDRIGRKPIIMAGCLLAALTYFPLFKALTHYANPALYEAQSNSPVTVVADPNGLLVPVRPDRQECLCQQVVRHRQGRPGRGARHLPQGRRAGRQPAARSGSTTTAPDPGKVGRGAQGRDRGFQKQTKAALSAAGYPDMADPRRSTSRWSCWWLRARAVRDHGLRADRRAAGGIVPGPDPLHRPCRCPIISATAGSAGFCPPRRWRWSPPPGDIYYGLWYPIVAAITVVVGVLLVPETRNRDLNTMD